MQKQLHAHKMTNYFWCFRHRLVFCMCPLQFVTDGRTTGYSLYCANVALHW